MAPTMALLLLHLAVTSALTNRPVLKALRGGGEASGIEQPLANHHDAAFSSSAILNDTEVEILELSSAKHGIGEDGFANVRALNVDDPAEGWCRSRNLTRVRRGAGLNTSFTAPKPRLVQRGATISNLTASPEDLAGP